MWQTVGKGHGKLAAHQWFCLRCKKLIHNIMRATVGVQSALLTAIREKESICTVIKKIIKKVLFAIHCFVFVASYFIQYT